MAKKQAVSNDDKLQKIVDHMESTGIIYSSSTLDQLAQKTNISSFIIKDLIKQLIDDNKINSEKIGAGTFYWIFKADKSQELINKDQNLKNKSKELEKEKQQLEKQLQEDQKFHQQNDGDQEKRQQLIQELQQLKAENKEKEEKVQQYNLNKQYIDLPKELEHQKQQYNILVDNIFVMKKYLHQKYGMSNQEIYKMLQITEDLDYIE